MSSSGNNSTNNNLLDLIGNASAPNRGVTGGASGAPNSGTDQSRSLVKPAAGANGQTLAMNCGRECYGTIHQ